VEAAQSFGASSAFGDGQVRRDVDPGAETASVSVLERVAVEGTRLVVLGAAVMTGSGAEPAEPSATGGFL
jgi:hypothetical protein